MDSATDSMLLKRAFKLSISFVFIIWIIRMFEWVLPFSLHSYAILPRELEHLTGILVAPLIHGSFSHITANSPTLLILGTILIYAYPRATPIVLLTTWIGSGLGVWLFAREAFHYGASGLTFGLLSFIFISGILRWDRKAIAFSMVVFFLYGGMFWGVFPSDPNVSFEMHFFGALMGLLNAFLLRNMDTHLPEKRYSWELEEPETDEEPYWLEQEDKPNDIVKPQK